MTDTNPSIEKMMVEKFSRLTPAERLRMAGNMFATGKKLVVAGLLHENPSLSRAQLRARTFTRIHGDCFSREETARIARRVPDIRFDPDAD